MDFDVDTIKPFTWGGNNSSMGVKHEWFEYITNNEQVRILVVVLEDEKIYETYYNPYREEMRKALNRILPR